MKIHWNENPLNTTVELNDSDREKILLYIQNEYYMDILCELDLWLKREIKKDDEPTLEKVHEKIRNWGEICNMDIDHEEEAYEEYLQMTHGGSCTCLPMTCAKCMAEEALGINTIEGLEKHSAHKIMGSFGENGTIDEAINRLETKPEYAYKPESWTNFSQKDYENLIPRWESDRKAALKWLKAYKEKHGF